MKTKLIIWYLLSLIIINQVEANEQDLLEIGCKMGVAVTQSFLSERSNIELTRMHFRCVGGIKNKPQVRQEFNKEKTLKNKKSYACGLGIGVALNFYSKSNFLNDREKMSMLLNSCLSKL